MNKFTSYLKNINSSSITNEKIDALIYYIIAIISVFIMVTRYITVDIIILTTLFGIIFIKKKGRIRINKIEFIFVMFIFLILVQLLIIPSIYFSIDIAFKEIVRNLIYILIISIVINLEITYNHFVKVWSSVFFIVFIIGVFQYFKVFNISILLSNVYHDSVHLLLANSTDISYFRAGSVFINPNVFAIFSLMILSIFLNVKTNFKNFKLLLILVSLILAGSRTAFLIGVLLLFITFTLDNYENFNIKKIIKTIIIILSIGVILYYIITHLDLSMFRMLLINEGFYDSLNIKLDIFRELIREYSVLNIFIGLGPFQYNYSNGTMVDFDLGYIFTYYGVIGMMIYLNILIQTYRYSSKLKRDRKRLNIFLIIICIMFGMTAGLYFDFRIFSIFSVIAFVNTVYKKDDSV